MRILSVILAMLFLYGCSDANSKPESMKLDLGDSSYAEFVDFLYDFSGSNRLNLQWFGWYRSQNASEWYERSDEKSTFKVNIHLLTEKNGYLYFSNGFEENSINFIVDYGDKKPVWIAIVKDFKKVLASKGWLVRG